MTLIPITCYRCDECNRIYEALPDRCICERQVYVKGERFGPFIIEGTGEEGKVKVKCILCDSFAQIAYNNIKRQQSCGCKPRHIETLELTGEVLVYRCRKCEKTTTIRVPVISYCCEEEDNGEY